MFVAVMVIYLIALIIEFLYLHKNKQKKELIVFCILSTAALTLNLLQIMDVKIPSPASAIREVVLLIKGE